MSEASKFRPKGTFHSRSEYISLQTEFGAYFTSETSIMPDLKNYKIGVLGGGISRERDISLMSAREVYLALKRKGFNAEKIDINTSIPLEVKDLLLSHGMDAAFIALHGEFGEDGRIQEILDELNIPYTGSRAAASRRAMDKVISKDTFIKNNIPTPGYFVLNENDPIPEPHDLPKVIKPYYSGSSIGVFIVYNYKDWDRSILKSFEINKKIIIEDYIGGRELTVGILDEEPLSVVEIMPKYGYFDFTAKYSDGMVEFKAPASLNDNDYNMVMEISKRAHVSLGCKHFSRVDIRMDDRGTPFVLEVNSIPGLTSHSLLPLSAKVCGIEFDELIERMSQLALRDEKKEKQKI